jgi:CHAT domain-containing protein
LNSDKELQFYLYGAINYDKNTKEILSIADEYDLKATAFNELSVRSGIEKYGYLGGTKIEVNQIESTAKQNGFSTTVFTETNASEENIKKLDGKTKPYVLHLATHGFFFPDVKQELPENLGTINNEIGKSKIYKLSDDPMMRSGLLFAGANNYWGKTSGNQTEDDGILTASEISNLDLSACQLVVMSACETGLGEIKGSEGVFGLQRAFKMAGVKNIIMSLWKVPDTQTAELFDVFYKACLSGKSIHDALQLAQSEMSKKYSPYYWAGFVLLE